MIIAELSGKIPSKLNDKEDILTSNVFSFFKYSNRLWFKDYLYELGFHVTLDDAINAEFIFWPIYEDRTQPDLVVICGKYYLLFEAKLYSDFSPKSTTSDSQIDREISMGKMSAENFDKEFVFIALTAEYYKNNNKYLEYENDNFPFIWTNWQTITSFIEKKIENDNFQKDEQFANDLFSLLVKKRLRSFEGILNIKIKHKIELIENVFYNLNTSKFKGEFTGFILNLYDFQKILPLKKIFIKSFFSSFKKIEIKNSKTIFYEGGYYEKKGN